MKSFLNSRSGSDHGFVSIKTAFLQGFNILNGKYSKGKAVGSHSPAAQ